MESPNLFTLPTYFINMNERKDRLKRFMGQPITKYMTRLRRIRAVNGKAIKSFKTDRRISLMTRFNILRNYRRSHREIATLGAVGASLSHIDVWRRFLASGEPMCLVFEDDAHINTDHFHMAHRLWKTLPDSWGIWILGYYEPTMVVEEIAKPWRRVHSFTAAHAYILTRAAAEKLMEEPLPIEMHIDHYMGMCGTMKDFLIVQHPDINIPFWGRETGPRVAESNTSQHKKRGCTVCNKPDDYKQLYRRYKRRGKRGLFVKGVIHGQQSNEIRTYRNTTRKRK